MVTQINPDKIYFATHGTVEVIAIYENPQDITVISREPGEKGGWNPGLPQFVSLTGGTLVIKSDVVTEDVVEEVTLTKVENWNDDNSFDEWKNYFANFLNNSEL